MSKRANPTVVGFFVIIGIVLAVATVLLLGSGKLLTPDMKYVLYFDESVNGLQKGAPVKFRGVTIGAVDEIQVQYDNERGGVTIPVIVNLNPKKILKNLVVPSEEGELNAFQQFVNHFVGRLESDSLVTGRMYIGLRHDPSADAKRVPHRNLLSHPEIPTEPSSFTAFMEKIKSVVESTDVAGLADRVRLTLDNLNEAFDEVEFDKINEEVITTIKVVREKIEKTDLDKTLNAFNETMVAAKNTLESLEKTSDDIRKLSGSAEVEIKPLMAGINRTTAEAAEALQAIEGTANELRALVAAQSPAYRKVLKTLDELNFLARSIRELSDKINRDPKMFLTGKPKPAR